MTQAATETAPQNGSDDIDRDCSFLMRLLLGAGIAAGAVVGFGVVWHENDLGIARPVIEQVHTTAPE